MPRAQLAPEAQDRSRDYDSYVPSFSISLSRYGRRLSAESCGAGRLRGEFTDSFATTELQPRAEGANFSRVREAEPWALYLKGGGEELHVTQITRESGGLRLMDGVALVT